MDQKVRVMAYDDGPRKVYFTMPKGTTPREYLDEMVVRSSKGDVEALTLMDNMIDAFGLAGCQLKVLKEEKEGP